MMRCGRGAKTGSLSSTSPSLSPSLSASISPSVSPSASLSPSRSPSISPSLSASVSPSASLSPSRSPSISPSLSPSISASLSPSVSPSASLSPSRSPSLSPSISPSRSPSISPSQSPSASLSPSRSPSISPSASPSISPSISPSASPSNASGNPTFETTHASLSGSSVQNITSTNWSISGSNRLLISALALSAESVGTPSGVKWRGSGGTSLSQIGSTLSVGPYGRLAMYGLIAPAEASDTSYYSTSKSHDTVIGGSIFIASANQSALPSLVTATGNHSASMNAAVTVTTQVGQLVVAAYYVLDQNAGSRTLSGVDAGSVSRYTSYPGAYEAFCIATKVATTTSTTVTFTLSGSTGANIDWGICAVAIAGA